MPAKVHIKFLFDISSPWSCVTFFLLQRYKEFWNLEIDHIPIFLGGIMVATKNTPPSAIPSSIGYMADDQIRICNRFGIDTRSPPGHPLNTTSLNQIRFLRAVKASETQEVLAECIRLVFLEFYAIQTLYTDPKFWHCLIPILGEEKLQQLLKASQTNENKDGVKADVLKAIDQYGMFGAPYLVVTRPSDGKSDVFFGADKIEDLAYFLGPEYPWVGPYPRGQDSSPVREIQSRL